MALFVAVVGKTAGVCSTVAPSTVEFSSVLPKARDGLACQSQAALPAAGVWLVAGKVLAAVPEEASR